VKRSLIIEGSEKVRPGKADLSDLYECGKKALSRKPLRASELNGKSHIVIDSRG